ncbi:MAG: helix-hairpin-helix domain-containing protein [Chitinispirillia bacterium]|nr:helix-hairpin-helix domain-containing protein [Chitinispirillia bacterium]MCL2267935.1 helix-hairpin-helix domain-containing protein [Chitinispirillia bacterium]
MRWQTGIPILSLSLASLVLLLAGLNYSKAQNANSSTAIFVDNNGYAARLDTLLPRGEIGLIGPPAPDTQETHPPEKPAPASASADTQGKRRPAGKNAGADLPASRRDAPAPCVNINTAGQAQLTTLKGIGPATAAAIILHRTQNGPFRKKEDIKNVKGIGPAKFAAIEGDICL